MVKNNLWRLLSIIFRAGICSGELDRLPHFDIDFSPLWGVDALDQADIDLARAQQDLAKAKTAQLYMDMGVIQPGEIRRSLYRK